jgi:CRP-like cAMP-binding protein
MARTVEVERVYQDGEVIVAEGEPGRDMFVIASGTVIVRRGGRVVDRLGRGQFFGEMSVLDSAPRDADVIAQGTTRVLVLGVGALLVRLRRDPTFSLEMLQAMSRRVRTLNEQLEQWT